MQENNRPGAPMTVARLNSYIRLRREYKWLAANRKGLEKVTDQVRGSMVEFPYTEHTITISGTDPERSRAMQNRMEALHAEMKGIERFVAGIDDGILRASCQLHFLKGLTWLQTASRLYGTPDSIRKAVERYMKGRR